MARTHWDAVADDISAIINPDEFAETVMYIPAEGRSREISAMVERNPPEDIAGLGDDFAPRIILWVRNDPESGIASDRIREGWDKVRISSREGLEEKSRTIVRILSHMRAAMQLEVR